MVKKSWLNANTIKRRTITSITSSLDRMAKSTQHQQQQLKENQMCIIITKERGAKPLPKDIFSRCWDNNPDGAGILWNDGHTTTLTKGIMNKADFMKKIAEVNKKENCFILHTRIHTHGSVKPENTHPFVSKTLGFAHNGTLSVQALPDATDSETFFKWTIEDKTFEWCKENKFLLDMATNGSRCAIFDMVTGEILHLCEDDWVIDEKYPGYMFSNRGYKPYEATTSNWWKHRNNNYCGYRDYSYDWFDDLDDDDYCSSQYNFDDEATKKAPSKLDEQAFEDLASKIRLLGIKRRKNNLNIEIEDIDEFLKVNCEINASSAAFAEMAKMIQELKHYEKEKEEEGIASIAYISARLMRQWFGRAKSLGFTNIAEVLIAMDHYIADIKAYGADDALYSHEEKLLIERLESDIEVWTDIYLEDMESCKDVNFKDITGTIKEDGEKDVLSDKDNKRTD